MSKWKVGKDHAPESLNVMTTSWEIKDIIFPLYVNKPLSRLNTQVIWFPINNNQLQAENYIFFFVEEFPVPEAIVRNVFTIIIVTLKVHSHSKFTFVVHFDHSLLSPWFQLLGTVSQQNFGFVVWVEIFMSLLKDKLHNIALWVFKYL